MEFLRNTIKKHFAEEPFFYHQVSSANIFISRSRNISDALNIYKNDREPVKVVHWFDNFWIYSELKFTLPDFDLIQSFTLSVFYGKVDDNDKIQLFRAEWDFNNNGDTHPQPHWHFYPKYEVRKFKKGLTDFIKSDERVKFLSDIPDHIMYETIELKKFHFAMNGQWVEGNGHKHKILNKDDFVKWFDGLLAHLKTQRRFVIGID